MVFSPRRYAAIVKKEYLELKRNTLFFLMTVLAPIALYFLFSFAFSLDAKNIPISVVDLDKSEISRSLIDSFKNASDLFDLKKIGSGYRGLERDMDLDRIRAIIVIPEDFSSNIKKGMPSKIHVMMDGVNPPYTNIVGSYISSILVEFQSYIIEEYLVKYSGSDGTDYPLLYKIGIRLISS